MSIFSRSWGLAARMMGNAFANYHPEAFPADLIGTKRNGGSTAQDKRRARKARNVKRHKRACK